jgi:hypothetical protein
MKKKKTCRNQDKYISNIQISKELGGLFKFCVCFYLLFGKIVEFQGDLQGSNNLNFLNLEIEGCGSDLYLSLIECWFS